jgi:pimeloyl-ACP methyl ester carboxylesterase
MSQNMPLTSIFDDPPRKHVLLLSCMDTRLLDNTVDFMDELNLQNRYDHVILAGASMGARQLSSHAGDPKKAVGWKHVFFDHLEAAIDKLHREIKDIFLLEHLDCGAYKELHPDEEIRCAYKEAEVVADLAHFHWEEAGEFAKEIREFCKKRQAPKGKKKKGDKPDPWEGIRVHCLLMNLLGDVTEAHCS